jgi:hypothetical protein
MTIDDNILNEITKKSPLLAKIPQDLYHCTSNGLDEKLGETHKYVSRLEEEQSIENCNYKEFAYNINDIGCRNAYPDPGEQNIIAFFGCSCTFGIGLASEDLFSTLVANELQRPLINLGINGAGFHRIALTFSAAVRVWNIKTAVITLPEYTRFHYVNNHSMPTSIMLHWSDQHKEIEKVRQFLISDFTEQYFMSAARDSLAWIVSTAREHDIELVLGSWDPDSTKLIRLSIDCPEDYVVDFFLGVDKARDHMHPGILANKLYADRLIKQIHAKKYI